MYDELIKRLRHDAKAIFGYVNEDLLKAADAIEDLQKCVDGLEADNDNLCERIKDLPQWIPATERLPEDGQKVLAFKTLDTKPPVPWYLILSYSTNLESVSEYEFQNETHGGFYEYDDGYYERTGITHWMPLPESPKDGE